MGKIDDFLGPKDQIGCEKIIGFYGCSRCDEDMDHAWWNESKKLLFWVCSKNHRTEQQLV